MGLGRLGDDLRHDHSAAQYAGGYPGGQGPGQDRGGGRALRQLFAGGSPGSGADFLVRGEGENTIPLFLEALAQGQQGGVIQCDTRPDLTLSPIPRFELLNLNHYVDLPIQTSRGCPHDCEFCDVVQLFGRRPRYKEPRQVIAELETLYRLGWRGQVFICDDNFIGSKTHARAILRELTPWSKSRGEPFVFHTQATVDLGQDVALIDQMTEANFVEVFLGLESPEEEALILSAKHHNRRVPCRSPSRPSKLMVWRITRQFYPGDGWRETGNRRPHHLLYRSHPASRSS